MNISVVIPNFNGEKIIRKNLQKVLDIVGNAEIILVDDNSTDKSLMELSNFKDKVKILKNEKNLGFSSTINRGVKAASGDIIILLNTDVVPEKDFLKHLIFHFSDDQVFAVGCMDKSIEMGRTILRGRGLGKWKKGFLMHFRGEIDKNNTLWVAGGSGAFKKTIWNKLGGLNNLYDPFYWEDIDLSYRAIKSGYKILFEPKSTVIHEHEKGAIKSTYSNFDIKTIAYRNQFIFVWSNITDASMWLNHLFWLPYHMLSAAMRKDLAFFIGFLRAIVLCPKLLKVKLKNKKLFVKKDNEILELFKNEK